MGTPNANSSENPAPGGHVLRWLVLVALAIGAIVAGRRFALSRADREFEERLRQADLQRD